jgi:hypothetical protein
VLLQEYTEKLLPKPEELTLPLCWSEERLQQLQHPDIVEGALAQQVRVAALPAMPVRTCLR